MNNSRVAVPALSKASRRQLAAIFGTAENPKKHSGPVASGDEAKSISTYVSDSGKISISTGGEHYVDASPADLERFIASISHLSGTAGLEAVTLDGGTVL